MRVLKNLLLMVLLISGGLSAWIMFFKDIPVEDTVYREAFDVESINLNHSPEGEWQGIYSLQRARCTGFKKVNYQSYDHYYMGSGATLSVPESERKPMYSVVERISDNDSEKWPNKVVLEIIDEPSGEILGSREVWKNDSRTIGFEGTSGYKGDISARFVRKVLNPPQQQWSSTCTTKYPRTDFEVSISEIDFTITKDKLFSKVSICADISIDSYQHRLDIRVTTPHWVYKTKSHPSHVYCIGSEVFIFHSIFWNELYVDWLDSSGTLKGQYKVKNSDPLVTADLKYDYIDFVELTDNILKVTQIQINPNIKANEIYSGSAVKSVFTIDVKKSQGRNDWCDGAGEKYTYFAEGKECNRVAPPNPMKSLNKSKHSDGLNAAGV